MADQPAAKSDGRMMRAVFLAILLVVGLLRPAAAQEAAWVQIEAQPTLAQAQAAARRYAARLENVNGYYLGGGWYGIALGPYTPEDAEVLLRQLRASGRVPTDSFVSDGRTYSQQFWPIGVGAPTTPLPLPDARPDAVAVTALDEAGDGSADIEPPSTDADNVAQIEIPDIYVPDETLSEARASEAALDRDQRKALQTALQWAGFYSAAIDGAFGRGTRGAMAAWQASKGYPETGVLTSAQREELLRDYNAVLDGMDMRLVRDDASGIEMQVPTGVVAFTEYEPPFVRFDAKGDLPATVLFISQPGDQDRLFGLYEILQTLAIVPVDGPRSRSQRSFEIEGSDDTYHTYAFAQLVDGAIKGFVLVWPAGDEDRRSRVLGLMRESFQPIAGVLDPALARPGEDQAVDLVSGLEVRKPVLSRSGFFIDENGAVLTTAEVATGQCDRLSIGDDTEMTVAHLDSDLGIAVLQPTAPLAPRAVAAFQTGTPRIQSEIAVAGFPYGGVLPVPVITFGRLADIRGLNGEEELKRLSLMAQPGDAGGPLFDNGGAVLGMLLPPPSDAARRLPEEVRFAADTEAILRSLEGTGLAVKTTDTLAFMPPEILTDMATDMTVLVNCW